LSGSYLGATSPIYDQATHLPFNGAPGANDMLHFALLLDTLLAMQNPLEDKLLPHIQS